MKAKTAATVCNECNECSKCEWNPFNNLGRKTNLQRINDLKGKGWRRGLDPTFVVLIDHAESQRTDRGIAEVFMSLLRRLDADRITVDCGWEDHCSFKITVTSGEGRRYTSTTHWGSDDTKICAYTLTGFVDGEEEWTLTDRYTLRGGMDMVNGHGREGGA